MANKTIEDVLALDFGYITGIDLVAYCPQEFLISKMNQNADLFPIWVSASIDEVSALLASSLNIAFEFDKAGEDRNGYIVKLVCLSCIQNITATVPALPDNLNNLLKWYMTECESIKRNQRSTPKVEVASTPNYQSTEQVKQSFSTIGG